MLGVVPDAAAVPDTRDVPAADVGPARMVHPHNTLNELGGGEWLYFTKSLWTTAYPSELGHAARKAHGANMPPRLMARLIEFFTRWGDGPGPLRGRRWDAARCRHLPDPTARPGLRDRATMGDHLRGRR